MAQLVESVSALAGPPQAAERARLGEARTCYDHLAGRLGVAVFDGLVAAGAVVDDRRSDGAVRFGQAAATVFGRLGVDLDRIAPQRRRLAYRCLDWTERRPHLGGALGAAVADAFLRAGWVRRRARDRGLDVAPRAWRQIGALPRRPRGSARPPQRRGGEPRRGGAARAGGMDHQRSRARPGGGPRLVKAIR